MTIPCSSPWPTRPRYPVPRSALLDLVSGGLMDAETSRYASWEELREYCRCVAGAVGLACTAVYGPATRPRPRRAPRRSGSRCSRSTSCGTSPRTGALGRVYLPRDERERFGVTEADIAAGRVSPAWQALMEHQAARAESLMREGLELLPLLDRRSALCVRAFAGIYRGLLVQMRRRGYDVFSQRPQLSAVGKLRAVAAL